MDIDIERKIRKSGIMDAFTPKCPISTDALFCGRANEAQSIVRGLYTPGGHVVLYGDRGVGKTSLANHVAFQLSKLEIDTHFISSCTSSDSFSSVAIRILDEFGIDYNETITTKNEGGIGIKGVVSGSHEREVQKKPNYDFDNPAWIASQIKNKDGVLIIDEFDTIPDVREREKFSLLMKNLSDNQSSLHILLVGISRNISDLMGGHSSIDRSLTQVLLPRMSDDELADIIEKGSQRATIQFKPIAKRRIVSLSNGMPYFTHSLALESSIIAISEDRKFVTPGDLDRGINEAMKNMDASLRSRYDKAVGVQGTTNMKRIIYSAAMIGSTNSFTLKQWTDKYSELFGETSQQSISGSMAKRIGTESDKIISKKDYGTYVFNDPQMPCYILLLGKP